MNPCCFNGTLTQRQSTSIYINPCLHLATTYVDILLYTSARTARTTHVAVLGGTGKRIGMM